MNMKFSFLSLAAAALLTAAAVFAVPTSQLSADIVFMNEDGVFDSGVNPGGAEDRTDTTLVGLPGAALLFTDASNGLTATLTTVDIIGADGTSFLAGTGTDDFHETNITGGNTLAVNTDTDQDDGLQSEAGQFNSGEFWVISFDEDVLLESLDFGTFELDAIGEVLIAGGPSISIAAGDLDADNVADFADTLVTAGTEISIGLQSGLAGTVNFNLAGIGLTVQAAGGGTPAVPEPSSLLAIAGMAGLFAVRRRR